MNENTEKTLFEQIEPLDDSIAADIPEEKRRPAITSPEWEPWVLAHLEDSEKDKVNGFPKTDGLRRIIPLIMGEIIESVPDLPHYIAIGEGDFAAAAKHTIVIRDNFDGLLKTFGGLGDSNRFNTDPPFSKYASAIAANRARGRAYRDCLRLTTVTAEEVSTIATSTTTMLGGGDKISDAQKGVIIKSCDDLGIELFSFINQYRKEKEKYRTLDEVRSEGAIAMIGLLNKYKKKTADVPKEILK